MRKAAILLGLAVFLVPALPLLFIYGPARRHRGRDTAALRALLRDHAGDPDLDRLLALRAVAHLPYHRLRALGAPGAAGPRARGRGAGAGGVSRSGSQQRH